MCLSFFFLYPMISFVARYYKETFMKMRVLINVHLWFAVSLDYDWPIFTDNLLLIFVAELFSCFQVHVYGTLVLLSVLISGLGIAVYGRLYYGYSRSLPGRLHVFLGWAAAAFYTIGLLGNGFRCKAVGLRKIFILIHSLSGFLFHFLSSKLTT